MRDRTSHKSWISALAIGYLVLSACGGDEERHTSDAIGTTAADSTASGPTRVQQVTSALAVRNADLERILPVRFQPIDAPRLDELRARERLDDVVASADDEFSRILLLKDWANAQFPPGLPDPYPPWDAIVVLDWIRAGITEGFCGQYAQVLLQALASFGITARYVEIGTVDNPYAHFVIEVWSDEHGKWVAMDADYNLHFESARGVPLSALEVHEALVQQRADEVVVVEGPVLPGHDMPDRWPSRTIELYYYYRVHLKADHISAPDEPPFDRFNDMVEWRDALTVPWAASLVPSPYPKERLTNLESNDREAFTNGPNRVRLNIDAVHEGEVLLRFENNMLQFERYRLRESGGEWKDYMASSYVWRPTPKSRELEVRAVNVRGVYGPPSTVRAFFD